MCGIVGIVGGAIASDERESLARRMAATLAHRGPEGAGAMAYAEDRAEAILRTAYRQVEPLIPAGPFKARIEAFVDYYNTERYHESLNNLTPADVYTGRGQTVLNRRRRIKQKTLAERRRLYYQSKAA